MYVYCITGYNFLITIKQCHLVHVNFIHVVIPYLDICVGSVVHMGIRLFLIEFSHMKRTYLCGDYAKFAVMISFRDHILDTYNLLINHTNKGDLSC